MYIARILAHNKQKVDLTLHISSLLLEGTREGESRRNFQEGYCGDL